MRVSLESYAALARMQIVKAAYATVLRQPLHSTLLLCVSPHLSRGCYDITMPRILRLEV